MKIISSILYILVLVFGSTLYSLNASFPSMSATHTISPTDIWYILMHASMSMYFFVDGAAFHRPSSTAIAFGPLLIAAFNMYEFPIIHNSATAITILFSLISICILTDKKERPMAIILSVVTIIVFLSGYLGENISLFFAEGMVLLLLGIGFERRKWLVK